MTTKEKIVWGGGALVGAAAALPVAAFWHERRETGRLNRRLDEQARAHHVFVANRLGPVPSPVRRYLAHTLRDGQPFITNASIVQTGFFSTRRNAEWRMHARQRFSTNPLGFVWEARIDTAPMAPTWVHDSYIGGVAAMRADAAGLFPVVNQKASRELNAAALTRLLAELVWLPTALLPDAGAGVRWMSADDDSAVASLTDSGTAASAKFTFDEQGDVVEILASDRFREVHGRFERTPWRVTCAGHEERDGIRIPTACEVAWMLPDGPFTYWRGTVENVKYEFDAATESCGS